MYKFRVTKPFTTGNFEREVEAQDETGALALSRLTDGRVNDLLKRTGGVGPEWVAGMESLGWLPEGTCGRPANVGTKEYPLHFTIEFEAPCDTLPDGTRVWREPAKLLGVAVREGRDPPRSCYTCGE